MMFVAGILTVLIPSAIVVGVAVYRAPLMEDHI